VRLVFEDQGWEDYTSWLKTDRKMLARINKLVEDVRRDPFTGIGKPEPLKYHLPGAWSRRIDDEHRLVYVVTEAEIIILAARYHYLPHRAIRRARSRRRPGARVAAVGLELLWITVAALTISNRQGSGSLTARSGTRQPDCGCETGTGPSACTPPA
jgi:toxin YoeB